ncbi:hypothetical protein [Actinosynnema sp. NPDC020468]|uniref:hypothetical protein n=1 Tax=Actinosynnema sp. NPDC020468 TaxID=3154488 RepID=UPI0033FF0C41
MGERGFDAQLLGRLEGIATEGQVHLLQRVLGGIDPANIFSKHASALAGLITELPRVHAALHHHHAQGQPALRLLTRLCANTARHVRAVAKAWSAEPLLVETADLLDQAQAATAEPGFRERAAEFATRLQKLLDTLPDLLETRFKDAWTTPPRPDRAAVVADEVACLLAFADRDLTAVEHDLITAAAHGDIGADAVWARLFPPPADYRVAGVVRGTGELAGLAEFHPGVEQQPLRTATRLRWGLSTGRLHKFVTAVTAPGEACVVSLTVTARDKPSAGRLARRTLVELLDQYMAGNRHTELELDPRVLVAKAGTTSTQELGPQVRSTPKARPLTTPRLPEPVRRSLRMAHIAARTDSPSAAAALSWSAVEACGLGNRDELAAALALQCLRQAVVHTHRFVRLSAVTRLAYLRNQADLAELGVTQATRAFRQCPLDLIDRRNDLRMRLFDAERTHRRARAESDERDALLHGLLEDIAERATYRHRHHLEDLNEWVAVLTTDTGLDTLLPHLHPLAVRQAQSWRTRLAAPGKCAKWLRHRQLRMTTVLDALYATRNLTLHAGVFHSAADTVHGAGAVMLTDLVLELLGNWYNSDASRPPVAVISTLARRHAHVLAELDRGRLPTDLDFENLTAPADTAPWRP